MAKGDEMKFEFDLADIFLDGEEGADETLEESIRRQVLNRITDDYRKRLFSQFDGLLAKTLEKQIAETVGEKIPTIVDDIMTKEYTPVDNYGRASAPTTFRSEIVKAISTQLVYQPKQYGSDENAFTRAVKAVVEEKTTAVKTEIIKAVDIQFKEDAIKFAVSRLAERLGIVKP